MSELHFHVNTILSIIVYPNISELKLKLIAKSLKLKKTSSTNFKNKINYTIQ